MIHNMKLRPLPFSQIKSGTKTIELRLYDEKRQCIQPGDTIIFSNTDESDLQLVTEVIALQRFATFADLFRVIPVNMCGFEHATVADAVAGMRKYYSKEYEKKYGVLGIEIRLVTEAAS